MSRIRLALLAVMVVWLAYDAMYATRWRWAQVAEDAGWIALIAFWPQVRDGWRRLSVGGES